MTFEFPHIKYNKSIREYSLLFRLPKEYENWKKVLPEISHKRLEQLAKSIFEEYELSTSDYPQLRWTEQGELKTIVVGGDCACASMHSDAYDFHNVMNSHQALAALEILVDFYEGLHLIWKEKSEKAK